MRRVAWRTLTYLFSWGFATASAAVLAVAATDVGEKRVGETSKHTGRHERKQAGRQAGSTFVL